jgi:hypothetical protein
MPGHNRSVARELIAEGCLEHGRLTRLGERVATLLQQMGVKPVPVGGS